jgi:hypothetical protein
MPPVSTLRIREARTPDAPRPWTRAEYDRPVALDDESGPEPDLAVVPGRPGDDDCAHPSRPALIVEVAESSLAFDRARKASLYARAGLADYWIVNLVDRVLEVHRNPAPDPEAPYRWSYRSIARLSPAGRRRAARVPGGRDRGGGPAAPEGLTARRGASSSAATGVARATWSRGRRPTAQPIAARSVTSWSASRRMASTLADSGA